MDTNSHIVRREEAYYNGWSEERVKWFREHGTTIYHPEYHPEPTKKPRARVSVLAWVLTALKLATS